VVRNLSNRAGAALGTWQPEEGDAALYALSGLFALLTIALSGNALYRQWAELAIGPYLAAALLSLVVGRFRRRRDLADLARGERRRHRQWSGARIVLFLVVLFGATLIPLSLEVAWRTEGDPAAHVQPEVAVVELAGHRAVHGISPYQASVKDGKVTKPVKGWPAYQAFYPYLPLMTVFGLPSSVHGAPARLTDARVAFSGVTLLLVLAALALTRAPSERKVRALQVLTALPTAALLLATGGDDMPILAFLLLAMALAQRRRPGWSGVVLGIVSSMKFTAWPLAALALFAARDASGKRAPGRMLLGMVAIAGPVVAPFLITNPHVFIVNVILFPLGLSGVASPAASPLPGHLLVQAFPIMRHVLVIAALAIGGAVLARRLIRRPPRSSAEVTALAGWVMLVAILVAPATRIGYLVYPINFFVWAFMFKGADRDAELEASLEAREPVLAGAGLSPGPGPGAPGA
jgi:Glycosyltransferase family 87